MVMYLILGVFFITFAVGKHKGAFMEKDDEWFALAFNVIVSILIWLSSF